MPGEGRSNVNHGLFVLGPEKPQSLRGAELDDSLTKAGNIPVAKDCPDPLDEAVLFSIALDILSGHKTDQSLAGC
jgi:hypothetical protein